MWRDRPTISLMTSERSPRDGYELTKNDRIFQSKISKCVTYIHICNQLVMPNNLY